MPVVFFPSALNNEDFPTFGRPINASLRGAWGVFLDGCPEVVAKDEGVPRSERRTEAMPVAERIDLRLSSSLATP